jgi:hypothetical protein
MANEVVKAKKRLDHVGILLLALVVAFAFAFLNSPGTDDLYIWIGWTDQTAKHGLVEGYRNAQSDYPPLSFAILTATVKTAPKLNLNGRTGIKLALFLTLVLTIALFFAYMRNVLFTAFLGLSLILSSVGLVYLDIFFAPFLIAALWALHKQKLLLFAIFYILACLIKWQPIVLAPFLVLYLLNINRVKDFRAIPWRRILLQVAAPVVAIVGAVLAIFGLSHVLDSLWKALNYPVLSAQALNANWLLTYFLNIFNPATYDHLVSGMPTLIVEQQGFLAGLPRLLYWPILVTVLILWFRTAKTFENLLLFLLLGYVTHFTFAVGAHENHLFIAVIISALLAAVNMRYLPLFVIWSLVANINLFIFYGIDGQGLPFSRVVGGFDTSILLATINVVLFVSLLVLVLRKDRQISAGHSHML